MMKRNTSVKTTYWNVVNIKSRLEQTPQLYVRTFEKLQEQDPLILLRGKRHMSVKFMQYSQYTENEGYPRAIFVKLSAYEILDPDRFYDLRSKKNVSLSIGPNIVANESEVEIIFIPRVHRFAIKKNAKVSLKNVVKYFENALDKVCGKESFDVTIVKDKDVIKRIFESHAIYKIEADITYSNRDPSSGFNYLFGEKVREMNPTRFKMNIQGTKDQPLCAAPDGLIDAAAELSESNGYIKARVREQEKSKIRTINTELYPLNLIIENEGEDLNTDIYNSMITRYGSENNNDNGQ